MTKRILITTGIYPPDIGGSASYTALLRRELPAHEFEVNVITYGKGSDENVRYVSRKIPKGLRHLIYFSKVIKLGKKADFILAADSSFGAAFIAALASKILKKKFIVRVTGDYAWEQGVQRFGVKDLMDDFQSRRYGMAVELLRKFQKSTAKTANIVIAPSQYLKSIVVGWGINEDKIKVVYNAVRITKPDLSKEEARSKLGLSGKVLVSAGRLVPWKGFDILIEAVAELAKKIEDVRLIVVGDGPEHQKLKAQTEKLGVDVLFTGSLPKDTLLEYLIAGDVFVLNTAYEGLSHQILEAMKLGLPIITTDVGGNPEIIKHNKSGILVEYNNKKQLIEAVDNVLHDEAFQDRLAHGAMAKAAEFTKEHMINNLKKLLLDNQSA